MNPVRSPCPVRNLKFLTGLGRKNLTIFSTLDQWRHSKKQIMSEIRRNNCIRQTSNGVNLKNTFLIILMFLVPVFLTGFLAVLEKRGGNNDSLKHQNESAYDLKNLQDQPESPAKNGGVWILPYASPVFKPWRDWSIEDPEIEAKSAILMEIKDGSERILFQKNIENRLPIASLTKIMTAVIAIENMPLEKIVKISKEAINQEGEAGKLVVDEEILVKNLLYAMLLESSNDAAFALASGFGWDSFIGLMNEKAKALQLKNTNFASPMGFDSPDNFSTSYDLARLINYSLKNQFLWQILKTSSFETADVSGKFLHRWENTNKLLNLLSNIVGGKTGFTNVAGGCIALVIENPKNNSKIISVLLGSPDENKRFEETEKLIDWVYRAYQW